MTTLNSVWQMFSAKRCYVGSIKRCYCFWKVISAYLAFDCKLSIDMTANNNNQNHTKPLMLCIYLWRQRWMSYINGSASALLTSSLKSKDKAQGWFVAQRLFSLLSMLAIWMLSACGDVYDNICCFSAQLGNAIDSENNCIRYRIGQILFSECNRS